MKSYCTRIIYWKFVLLYFWRRLIWQHCSNFSPKHQALQSDCRKFPTVIENSLGFSLGLVQLAAEEIGMAFLHLALNETFMSHENNCKLCLIFVFRAVCLLNIYQMMKALYCKKERSSNLISILQAGYIILEQTH